MAGYLPRIYDDRLRVLLSLFGGVLVEGPKWCGKTWTSRHVSASELSVADPKDNYATRKLVMADVSAALGGHRPRLIDEWQEVPELWDAVRFEIDAAGERGLFVLTGSSNPPRGRTMHSGTGRIARLRMAPMTLSEAGVSQGEVPFACLVSGQPLPRAENPLTLGEIASLCVRGGWPGNLETPPDLCQELPRQYVLSLVNEDVSRYDDVARDPIKMDLLLRSLARNNQTLVSKKTLLADIGQLSEPTLNSYLNVLTNLFVLRSIPAWSPAVRSRGRLRAAEKVRFVDPSLALAALRVGTTRLVSDWETFGLMFECLVTRDILAFTEVTGAKVFHYREAANQGRREREVDLVVETSDDEYSLIEVKLNAAQIEDAEAALVDVSAKLVAGGAAPPLAQVIICGTVPYAYTTERGIKVIPFGCLGQ
ncbi:MAG: DUF4143 domain-containing protein [Bifidobacteriaceae bacterium]|jgi:predicted AAA+ superfamily ATPase|nr:DUF4143 domain-containing protein [Bifidobacteriaceae bacterium]